MSIDRSAPAPEAGALSASVIVPHYNQSELLRRCLHSLTSQSQTRETYEIIVCDNGTPGGVDAIIAEFPQVRFVFETDRGAAAARNKAMSQAKGAAFAFIDADCIADECWLENGLKALETVDLAGGEITVCSDNAANPTAVEAFELVFAFHQQTYIERKRFSVTANLFATRAAAEAIGNFKNGVAEDLDWCRRARALGFRLAFNRTSIISHPARRDWGELTKKWDRLILERWRGAEEHSFSRRIGWAALAIITALSAAPHLGKVVVSPRIKRLKHKLSASAVLIRIRLWRACRMLALL